MATIPSSSVKRGLTMIDNKLLVALNEIASNGESLEMVAAMLNNKIYKDIRNWYQKYTRKNIEDDLGYGCAELLVFMLKHENLDLLPVECCLPIQEELSNRYGVNVDDVFLFVEDYRRLLLG